MTEALPFRLVGLTGGIASGKSTVSRRFQERGLLVLDADLIAREVVEPGTSGLQAIVDAFGGDILDEEGRLKRGELGARIFASPEARATLNQIVHPRVGQRTMELIQEARESGRPAVVYEAPLLIENGIHQMCDLTVVVSLPAEVQVQRLMERDGLSLEEAEQRLRSQFPLEKKLEVADQIIDNAGTYEETRSNIDDLLHRLGTILWPDAPSQRARAHLGLHTEREGQGR